MSTEWRLSPNGQYGERSARVNAAADAAVLARVAPAELELVSAALAHVALQIIRSEEPKDAFGTGTSDAPVATAAAGIYDVLSDHDRTLEVTPESRVLSRIVVGKIASGVSRSPELWVPAFRVAARLVDGWDQFVSQFEPDAIRSRRDVLFVWPGLQEPKDWLDTFGRLRSPDVWTAFVRDLGERRRLSRDLWRHLDELGHYARDVRMSSFVRIRSDLARRGGPDVWVQFLSTLPLTIFAQIELLTLDSLDEAQSVLSVVVTWGAVSEDARLTLTLVIVRRIAELFENVWTSLAHGAEGRWLVADDEEGQAWQRKCEAALQEWRGVELKARATTVAESLASNEAIGVATAVAMVQNLFVGAGPDRYQARTGTVPVLRDALVGTLLQHHASPEAMVSRVLEGDIRPAIVVAAMDVFHSTSPESRDLRLKIASPVWKAYATWISSAEFVMHSPLLGDEFGLAWRAAGVLAEMESPLASMETILKDTVVPAEGWNHDWQRFFDSIARVSHVLVVAAMSTEWLAAKSRDADAASVFDVAWTFLHRWTRGFSGSYGADEQISTALANLWGRLTLVHRSEALRLALWGAECLDRLDWILVACRNLQVNLKKTNAKEPLVLDVKLQELVERRFREQFPALRAQLGVSRETLEQFQQWERELTPSLPPHTP